jgi:predicted ribosomally synthesized peptide with SipW-like signal peptide
MSELVPSASSSADEALRRRRRRTVTKFGLAGLAVLGIGAAATSAAWTDDAWFTGTASAATVELQGASSVTPLTWIDADTVSGAVVIPATAFADLLPGDTVVETLNLRNTSSVPLVVAAPAVVAAGDLFSGAEPATAAVTAPAFPVTLAPGATSAVTLTVAAPEWDDADAAYQGATGTLTVQFTGTP